MLAPVLTTPRVSLFTNHASRRAQQRNFSRHEIDYVLKYGRVEHRTGIRFHFLADRDIPRADLCFAWVRRLAGTTVLVASDDSSIITVYKNPKALHEIKKKSKHSRF